MTKEQVLKTFDRKNLDEICALVRRHWPVVRDVVEEMFPDLLTASYSELGDLACCDESLRGDIAFAMLEAGVVKDEDDIDEDELEAERRHRRQTDEWLVHQGNFLSSPWAYLR